MATGAASPQNPAVPLRYRPSVSELTDQQVNELRASFAAMQAISDDRGYQHWAGIHGLPLPAYCDMYGHGKPTFLQWHRAYLFRFELALRATGHDVMIPWWDWTAVSAVPGPYSDAETAQGQPNPLYSVRITDQALAQGGASADPGDQRLSRQPNTARDPGQPGTELPTSADIAQVMAYNDFSSFSSNLEDWHGQVHMWVGGHMSDIAFAAYDPLFWAHHCMIDRLWRIWQLSHPQSSLPATLTGQIMAPFEMTAAQTLDVTTMGYDYASSSTTVSAQ